MKYTHSTEFPMHIGLPSICSTADIIWAILKEHPNNNKFKPHMTTMKANVTWIILVRHILFGLIFFSVIGRCPLDVTMLSQTIADRIWKLHNDHIWEGERKTFLEQSQMRMKLIQFPNAQSSKSKTLATEKNKIEKCGGVSKPMYHHAKLHN
jgi:hypothetical protein